jgi:hypothetical protein
MTMTLVPDHRRTRGKLVLLAALFVTLMHASTATVKMVSESLVAADFSLMATPRTMCTNASKWQHWCQERTGYNESTPMPSIPLLMHH